MPKAAVPAPPQRTARRTMGDIMSGFGGMGGPNEEVQALTKKLQELELPEETRKIID